MIKTIKPEKADGGGFKGKNYLKVHHINNKKIDDRRLWGKGNLKKEKKYLIFIVHDVPLL